MKTPQFLSSKIIFLAFLLCFSCKKETLDDMFLSDGMVVFNLNGKDWKMKDMVASFSDLTNVGGGQIITISGSVDVDTFVFKTVEINITDSETLMPAAYQFSEEGTDGSYINIDEGKTASTGIRYKTTNPDNSVTGTGKVTITIFDKVTNRISGTFSGEICKSDYNDVIDGEWSKTSIKSGRFHGIPVIIGK